MILGLGNDIIDIRRIEKTLERYGERFLNRVFTDTERRNRTAEPGRAASYAKRFAAKEACAKALGTGLQEGRVLARHGRRQPAVGPAHHGADRRGGRAAQAHHAAGFEPRVDLTLTDDFPLAQAIVVISAVPDGSDAPDRSDEQRARELRRCPVTRYTGAAGSGR